MYHFPKKLRIGIWTMELLRPVVIKEIQTKISIQSLLNE
jgi:hypothetical protein